MTMIEELVLRIAEKIDNSYFGKFRGMVTDNQDPQGKGRIKAKVPEVLGDIESGWCLPCVPYAGSDHGTYLIPEPDDGVWIEFEGGDPSRPIWVGSWWAEGEVPDSSPPEKKVIRTSSGNTIILDDTGGSEKIELISSSGSRITLDSTGITLENSSQNIKISSSSVKINDAALEIM